jgi:hypothetical protein
VTFALRDPKDARLHFSTAKRISVSAAHARYYCENPPEPTPAMQFGGLVDAILMPHPARKVIVFGGKVRNGKAWEEFEACNPNCLIARQDEYDRAVACAEAITRDPVVREMAFLSGKHQVVARWTMHGLPWATGIGGERGGFDLLGDTWIADVKMTTTTEPRQWSRQARRMFYPEQLAAYREAAKSLGHLITDCYLIGCETRAPHCVTVMRVPEQDLADADKTLYNWCERIKQCEAANAWPGYVQSVTDIEPKDAWAGLLEDDGD